jgi:hypothetical protein
MSALWRWQRRKAVIDRYHHGAYSRRHSTSATATLYFRPWGDNPCRTQPLKTTRTHTPLTSAFSAVSSAGRALRPLYAAAPEPQGRGRPSLICASTSPPRRPRHRNTAGAAALGSPLDHTRYPPAGRRLTVHMSLRSECKLQTLSFSGMSRPTAFCRAFQGRGGDQGCLGGISVATGGSVFPYVRLPSMPASRR